MQADGVVGQVDAPCCCDVEFVVDDDVDGVGAGGNCGCGCGCALDDSEMVVGTKSAPIIAASIMKTFIMPPIMSGSIYLNPSICCLHF